MSRPIGSRYEVETQLGRGAFGTVWRGLVRETGEAVAIKMLREDLANDGEVVTRFLHERRALTSLRHPSIVSVRDLVVEGDQLALVMQLVDGPDLKAYLAERGRLDPAEAGLLVGDVAQALAAAHRANIIHRDIKPANVLLDQVDGGLRPLLTDFGVARLADAPSVTKTHQVVGTPYYLSPEVIAGRPPTPAMDVYAAGVMTFELCAGRPPFTGADAMTVFRAHMDNEPERPEGLTDGMWEVIVACMAKDPRQRPDAAGLALRLRELFGLADGGQQVVDGAATLPVRIHKADGTMLLPLVEPHTPRLDPVGPATAIAEAVRPPAGPMPTPRPLDNGPYAGWDAPPSRDALSGYRPRAGETRQAPPQTAIYPEGQRPASPYGAVPAPFESGYPQQPQQPQSYGPLRLEPDQYEPEAYEPQRYEGPRQRSPQRRPPEDDYQSRRAERPRPAPRRRRGLGCGFGCLMQLLVLIIVVVVGFYIAQRIDHHVHVWLGQVQHWFNTQITNLRSRW